MEDVKTDWKRVCNSIRRTYRKRLEEEKAKAEALERVYKGKILWLQAEVAKIETLSRQKDWIIDGKEAELVELRHKLREMEKLGGGNETETHPNGNFSTSVGEDDGHSSSNN